MFPVSCCLLLSLLADPSAAPLPNPPREPAAAVPLSDAPVPRTEEDLIRERLERARLRYRLLAEDLPARRKAWREQLDSLRRKVDPPAPAASESAPNAVGPKPLPSAPLPEPRVEPSSGDPAGAVPTATSATPPPAPFDDLALDLERLAAQARQLAPRARTAPVPQTAGCPGASSR